MQREWITADTETDAVHGLVSELGISAMLAQLLVNRDVRDADAARRYLDPRLADLADPLGMAGMAAAVKRILSAVDAGERICVWGDYDVDGVTSTTLLLRFFQELGVQLECFIPDRFEHGYGLSAEPIGVLAGEGTRLLIAVDCGISNVAEVAHAAEHGVDVIIIDHHEVGPELPPAVAVINPLQPGCAFAFKRLAAVGLTFHLLIALRGAMRARGDFADRPEPDLRRLLDVVAIGTIADMVPLQGPNRILARHGVARIATSENLGVQALVAVSGGDRRPVDGGFVAFQIGPRINAAGRLASARRGVELLTAERYEDAHGIAIEVDAENRRRRDIEARILEEALAQVDDAGGVGDRHALVLAAEGWHAGVTGIVANRVVERHHRPTFLIALEDGLGRGSVRSISGFHVVRALRECEDLLATYGGHAHAAGLTLDAAALPAFTDRIHAIARRELGEDALVPRLRVDGEIAFREVDVALVGDLRALEPFGIGNRRPLFTARSVEVIRTRVVRGNHLQLWLRQDGVEHRGIAFGMGDAAIASGDGIEIAFHVEENVWQGRREIQLQVRDVRSMSPSPTEDIR